MARRGLDGDAVVAAAVRVADRDGFEALTLAAVAAEVGVRVPSLYHHVDDGLPGLRARVRRHALEGLAARLLEATAGRSGRPAIAGLIHALHGFGVAHPGLLAATVVPADDPEGRAAGEAVVDVAFDVLRGYGLEGEPLVHATRVLRAAVHSFAALDAAGGFARPEAVAASLEALASVLDGGLRAFAAEAAPTG
ncbi:MAG: TetR-like C-terminal domain-containing protein [Trueperaceae bacterium]|nr:TetR-like C-terminal domain-containing protein [Trueperaceae bacterium]